MVAGATGIDLFLMCVAADDGVMPQTREHLAVLRGLGVTTGVVAITKADLGEPELAAAEAAELLPGARGRARSRAHGGRGLDELRGRAGPRRRAACRAARPTTARRGCTSTARSRCGARHGGDRARCGRARSGAATSVRVLPRGLERARARRAGARPAGGARRRGPARRAQPRRRRLARARPRRRGRRRGGRRPGAHLSARRGADARAGCAPAAARRRACRSTTARARRRRGWSPLEGDELHPARRLRPAAAGGAARAAGRRPRDPAPARAARHAWAAAW